MATAIRITDLHKSFKSEFLRKQKPILKGISLEVEQGEIFGYLGPNGAGKTTTLKCLLGLIFPKKAKSRSWASPISPSQPKHGIGYLPENPYFYDYLTAREFLQFYGQLHLLTKSEQEAKIPESVKKGGLAGSRRSAVEKIFQRHAAEDRPGTGHAQ